MTEISVKKRFSSDSHQTTQRVCFCKEVRDFIADSHKCQTLFANCEGFYPRRVVNCGEKKLLQEFIFCSMYYKEYDEWKSQLNSERMIHAMQICDKMISLSKKYNADDEIHFSVVWVYCFEYELKAVKAMPVFKIFKKKSGSEAVFLDDLLKSYESWDCYLENGEFKESFLCFPQHGEYRFDNETNKLILEYQRSFKLKTNDSEANALPKTPFSQVAVRPLFTILRSFVGKTSKTLAQFLHTLCSYWNVWKGPVIRATIFILLSWLKAQEFLPSFLGTVSSAALMLLNTDLVTEKTEDCNNPLKRDGLSKLATSFNSNFSELQKSRSEIPNAGTRFFELLLRQKKDWVEILTLFCSLLRTNRSVLNEILHRAPNSLTIKYLICFLNLIEKISGKAILLLDSSALSKTENCTSNINLDHKNGNFEINSSVLPVSCTSSSSGMQNKMLSTVDFETQSAVDQIGHRSYEKVLSNLPCLETISVNAICNLFFKKSSAEFLENMQLSMAGVSSADVGILVGKEDGYGIYLFPMASIFRLTKNLSRLLKTDFHFKPREGLLKTRGVFMIEVISRTEKTLGFLFFPFEFSAFGLFPLEVIQEKEKNSLTLWPQ